MWLLPLARRKQQEQEQQQQPNQPLQQELENIAEDIVKGFQNQMSEASSGGGRGCLSSPLSRAPAPAAQSDLQWCMQSTHMKRALGVVTTRVALAVTVRAQGAWSMLMADAHALLRAPSRRPPAGDGEPVPR